VIQTERFFHEGYCPAQWRSFQSVARRKLDQLDQATQLNDLRIPGNRLEKLRGDREGQWSIRVNKQWRVCFTWGRNGPARVEIADYHD
jgi:proteic killer suppression protein